MRTSAGCFRIVASSSRPDTYTACRIIDDDLFEWNNPSFDRPLTGGGTRGFGDADPALEENPDAS